MRVLLLITAILSLTASFAQKKHITEQLYYFRSKGFIGVRNDSGKIIIPPVNRDFEVDLKQPIVGDLIFLNPIYQANIKSERFSWGIAYDRKGKALFAPFGVDNGPDGLHEGLMRYVKNGKMGFVNRMGKIVIPAKWDYINEFEYGTAQYCKACKPYCHHEIVWWKGGYWGVINHRGDSVTTIYKAISIKDREIDSTCYIPYPFNYTHFEKAIVDSFNKLTIISKAYFVNYSDSLDSTERTLQYEIVEKPSSFFPYYHVQAFDGGAYHYPADELDFYITKNGLSYYNCYGGDMIPLKRWLYIYTKQARSYIQAHPDAPNKF